MNSPKLGDENNYKAYVGPPARYDYFAGLVFKILFDAGLRSHHNLFDIGAGSLRVGKLLIPYLDKGKYFAVEPNEKILKAGIDEQLGDQIIELKEAVIYNRLPDFEIAWKFDFILAHSVFTHAGRDVTDYWLDKIKKYLRKKGTAIVTFYPVRQDHPHYIGIRNGWFYPDCVGYAFEDFKKYEQKYKLSFHIQDWEHPSQKWIIIKHGL